MSLKKTVFILSSILFGIIGCNTTKEYNRPNILIIMADDQSPFDLKTYNPKSALSTPNIDRLAAEGMVFDASYHMGAWAGAVANGPCLRQQPAISH